MAGASEPNLKCFPRCPTIRPVAARPEPLLLDFPQVQRAVPLGAHGMRFDLELFEIFTFHLLPSLIKASIQECSYFQSGSRARSPNDANMVSRVLRGFPCQFVLI